MKNASSIPRQNFSCLTRLNQNRTKSQLAKRLGVVPSQIKNVIIWGNHSKTQFPDASAATVNVDGEEKPLPGVLADDVWPLVLATPLVLAVHLDNTTRNSLETPLRYFGAHFFRCIVVITFCRHETNAIYQLL